MRNLINVEYISSVLTVGLTCIDILESYYIISVKLSRCYYGWNVALRKFISNKFPSDVRIISLLYQCLKIHNKIARVS